MTPVGAGNLPPTAVQTLPPLFSASVWWPVAATKAAN
jgi:hypothetical protein